MCSDKGVSYALQTGAKLSRAEVYWFEHNDVADLTRILEQIKVSFPRNFGQSKCTEFYQGRRRRDWKKDHQKMDHHRRSVLPPHNILITLWFFVLCKVFFELHKTDRAIFLHSLQFHIFHHLETFLIWIGLYLNYGDVAPLDKIMKLKEKYCYRLIMDDTYGIGVLGKTGRGTTEHYNVPVSVTCSKNRTNNDVITGERDWYFDRKFGSGHQFSWRILLWWRLYCLFPGT